jgi:hypothetical protein
VVYASQPRSEWQTEVEDPILLDPSILRSARQIYRTYYDVNRERMPLPLGVAINRYTHRGKVIFTRKPILLPQESFVPFTQLESEGY